MIGQVLTSMSPTKRTITNSIDKHSYKDEGQLVNNYRDEALLVSISHVGSQEMINSGLLHESPVQVKD